MNFYYWFFFFAFLFSVCTQRCHSVVFFFCTALLFEYCKMFDKKGEHISCVESWTNVRNPFKIHNFLSMQMVKEPFCFFFIIFWNADAYEAKYRHLTCTGFHSFFASSLNFSNGTRSFSNKKNSERKKNPVTLLTLKITRQGFE